MATSSTTWASLLPLIGAVAGYGIGEYAGDYGQIGASIGGSLGGALATSQAQAATSKAQAENWDKYAEMMKLSPDEEQALIAKGKQRLSQNMLASNKELSRNLASRNLGGGMLATGLADTSRAYDTAVGNLTSDVLLKDVGNVPNTLPPVQLGSGTYLTGNLGQMAGELGGMGVLSSMFETDSEKKKRLAASSGGNWWNQLTGSPDTLDWWESQPETWGQFGSGRYGTESL